MGSVNTSTERLGNLIRQWPLDDNNGHNVRALLMRLHDHIADTWPEEQWPWFLDERVDYSKAGRDFVDLLERNAPVGELGIDPTEVDHYAVGMEALTMLDELVVAQDTEALPWV